MGDIEEILKEIKEGKAAEKALREYAEARRHNEAVEKYRASLLRVIGADPGKYAWSDYYSYREKISTVIIPKEDESLLLKYIEGAETISIVEVAIRERLQTERKAEAEDLFLHGLSIKTVAAKYGVSEKTVKRLRRKGLDAIEKEIALRLGCGRVLSTSII